MLKKSQNYQPLAENDNPISDSVVITKSMATVPNKTMEKPAVASE